MPIEHTDEARERIGRIFRYLRELNLHRNPAKRRIQDQRWYLALDDLPDHRSIARVTVDVTADSDQAEAESLPPYLIKVDRPTLTRPPTPPEILAEWFE